MTEKEWRGELDAAVAGGLPWRVSAAWCQRGTAVCGAELTHTASGQVRGVSLSLTAFASAATRKAEVIRQLTSDTGKPHR
jgi:hypothetical protein